MELPDTYFKEMAKKAPIVIANGSLYLTKDTYDSEENFIETGGRKYGLLESETIENIENFYAFLNKEAVFELKKIHVQNAMKERLHSYESLLKGIDTIDLVSFIIEDVFPKIIPPNVDALFSEDEASKSPKEAFLEKHPEVKKLFDTGQKIGLEETRKQIENVGREGFSTAKKGTSFSKIFTVMGSGNDVDRLIETVQGDPSKGVITFGNEAYALVKERGPVKIKAGGTFYMGPSAGSIEFLEKNYKGILKTDFEDAAMSEAKEQQKIFKNMETEYAKTAEAIDSLQRIQSFNLKEAGFVKSGSSYYISVNVPKFALKDTKSETENYYIFPPCRVGVRVTHGNGIIVGKPVIIDEYTHPFLRSDDQKFQEICLGPYY